MGVDASDVASAEFEFALEIALERLQISAFDFDGEAGFGRDHHFLDGPRDTWTWVHAPKLTPLVGASHDRVPANIGYKDLGLHTQLNPQ